MVIKKSTRKKVSKKRVSVRGSSGAHKDLVKNFIELQKVMTLQSMKIDKLTTQISGLLDLFSSSAKALAKKEFGAGKSEEIAKLNDKLDDLFTETQKMSQGIMNNASKEPEEMYSQSIQNPAPALNVPATTNRQGQINGVPTQPPTREV